MTELLQLFHRLVQGGVDLAIAFDVPTFINAGVYAAISGLILLGALGVVFFKNVVHSALSLTASFIGIGCLFIYLSAEFMGAVQIMVYGGAVAVLIAMAIMLTRRDTMAETNPTHGLLAQAGALVVSGLFGLALAAVVLLSPFLSVENNLGDSVTGIADLMLTTYILPFEAAAVLLLIAMVGAILLAKGAEDA